MSNPIQSAISKHEFAFYVRDLINATNFYFYHLAVDDVLTKLHEATLSEIREGVFQTYKNQKIKLTTQQKATITRRISEILQFEMKENRIVKINNKYSFKSDLDSDNWRMNSKFFPKKAQKLVWWNVYFSKLTPEQKDEISFLLHQKLLEKYARRKALYEISKILYGLKDERTQYNQFRHKYEEQTLQLFLALIKKAGFLQEFYNHLESFEQDDTESNTKIDNLTLELFTKYKK